MQGLLAGAIDLMSKPFSPYRLIARVQAALPPITPSAAAGSV
jgi:DNA-binding response OmpR family regulator